MLDLDFDKENSCLKIFTHLVDLYDCFECNIEHQTMKNLLAYHISFLNILQKILSQRQLYLLKHLELLGDQMRNIYSIFTNFQEKEFFVSTILRQDIAVIITKLQEYYEFSHIISKDVLSQISVLILFYQLRIEKVFFFKKKPNKVNFKKPYSEILKEHFGSLTETTSENEIIVSLSKIRALVLLQKNPGIHTYQILNGKETLLSYIINVCANNSQFVKLYSFRVLLLKSETII